MTGNEQVQALADDLGRLIDRYRQEFELSLAAVVGTLHVVAHELIHEAIAAKGNEGEEPL